MSDTSRIELLETQVRTLKRMLIGVFGLVVVGGLLAATTLQSVPDVIQAKEFEVINDNGTTQASLGSYRNGGILTIENKEGEIVNVLSATSDGGALSLYNNKRIQVLELAVDTDSNGSLIVCNKDGKSAAGLAAIEDYGGVVTTLDTKGKVSSQTPETPLPSK
ncbi:MAG: hypothetical protein VX527_09090 [Planctomycetota bacterium]|nr:hypothetical protein [Planctomycetota bacterium]